MIYNWKDSWETNASNQGDKIKNLKTLIGDKQSLICYLTENNGKKYFTILKQQLVLWCWLWIIDRYCQKS